MKSQYCWESSTMTSVAMPTWVVSDEKSHKAPILRRTTGNQWLLSYEKSTFAMKKFVISS